MEVRTIVIIVLAAAFVVIVVLAFALIYRFRYGIVTERIIINAKEYEAVVDRRAQTYSYGEGSERAVISKRDDMIIARHVIDPVTRSANPDERYEWNRLFQRAR